MATVAVCNERDRIDVPKWVVSLGSFRRWVQSDECPEKGRIEYIKGKVWIDMSREQAFSHNQVKAEIAIVLGGLVKREQLGLYFVDGMRLTNKRINFSAVPDGTFVINDSFRSRRARLVKGREKGFTELAGIPDLLVEVVSDSSEDKDTEWMMKNYWESGVPEYWLIDARDEPLRFDIFRRTAKGYTQARKQGGWVKSTAFGRSFRLTKGVNALGQPEYTLSLR